MRAEDLFEAIGEIDDQIIESSEALYENNAAGTAEEPAAENTGASNKIGHFQSITPPVNVAKHPSKKPDPARTLRRWYPAIAAAACILVGFVGIYAVMRPKGNAMESADSSAAYEMEAAVEEEEMEEAAPAEATAEAAEYEYDEAVDAAAGAEEAKAEEPEAPAAEGNDFGEADNPVGVYLSAQNVTPAGLDLVCTQSGGSVTGELQTGTEYAVEVLGTDGAWTAVPYVTENVGWEDLALLIPQNGQAAWPINWEWLYGQLAPGSYRISKQIMDFRGTGDYDTYVSYAYFDIP